MIHKKQPPLTAVASDCRKTSLKKMGFGAKPQARSQGASLSALRLIFKSSAFEPPFSLGEGRQGCLKVSAKSASGRCATERSQRDREFVLLIKQIDFFDKLKPQILLRFLFIWYGLTSPPNYCILLLDFFRRLWYNNKVFCIEPVIMGVSPVQGSSVNHVRRGTEQH